MLSGPQHLYLATIALLLCTQGVAAQARADSTTTTVLGDSVKRGSDTTGAAPSADTSGSRGQDSASAASSSAVAPSSPAVAPPPIAVAAPVDSVLARACRTARPGAPAPGLLGVVFRAQTPDSERVKAAREVGGELAGVAASGEDYVRLSGNAGPLRIAAARLIRVSPVASVTEVLCPR